MQTSSRLRKISAEIRKCKKCRLYKHARKAVPGEGPAKAKIFFVGQAPGNAEDKTGRPFVGRSGNFLDKLLRSAGLKRKNVFITSVVKHFPPRNRTPKKDEIKACKPYIIRQLKLVNPKIVVLLGKVAQNALAGEPVLKGKKVVKTAHPAAGRRFPKIGDRMEKDFAKLKKLVQAVK